LSRNLPSSAADLLSGQRSMLVVYRGAQPKGTLALDEAPVVAGRAAHNQLVLNDASVAPEHFRIQRERDGWLLFDLGSAVGTFVNGDRVKRAWLKPGAEIRAGAVTLRFTCQKERLRAEPSEVHRFGALVGDSVVMREVFTLLERIAPSEATLLVIGEAGTGKGALARSVHEKSRRANGPFVAVDCATGIEQGLLEAASGGTLYLDHIDALPLGLQPTLLRALEERVFQRPGSTEQLAFDARIIGSSKKELWKEVQQGRLREDLFFRLSVFTVNLPPLRDRREDIPALASALAAEQDWNALPEELRRRFLAHDWPGNVRELRDALQNPAKSAPPPREPVQAALAEPGDQGLLPADYALDFKAAKDLLLAGFEREYLSRLLQRTGGNVAAAARLAKVDRKHLARLIRRHGLERRH
jgi:DNA-binding NtrC family response regulator